MFAWIILLQLKRGAAKAASLHLYVKLYQLKIIENFPYSVYLVARSLVAYVFLLEYSIHIFAFHEMMLKNSVIDK